MAAMVSAAGAGPRPQLAYRRKHPHPMHPPLSPISWAICCRTCKSSRVDAEKSMRMYTSRGISGAGVTVTLNVSLWPGPLATPTNRTRPRLRLGSSEAVWQTHPPGLRVASTRCGRTWTFPVVSSSYQGTACTPYKSALQLYVMHWVAARDSPRLNCISVDCGSPQTAGIQWS